MRGNVDVSKLKVGQVIYDYKNGFCHRIQVHTEPLLRNGYYIFTAYNLTSLIYSDYRIDLKEDTFNPMLMHNQPCKKIT